MNNQLKILIVEDEPFVAMDMSDMLEKMEYQVLQTVGSYEEAVQSLEANRPDFVLIDINLEGKKTGIDLANFIREKYSLPFVYVTSHSDKETVQLTKQTQPNGYVVKPFEAADLYTTIESALANYNMGRTGTASSETPTKMLSDSLFVKTDKNFVKIKIDDILWLQSDGNYLYLFTDKKKSIVRSTFKDFMQNLPVADFIQIHKSYIVNIHKIDSFTHDELSIHNTQLPLSRFYKDELLNKLNRVL
ncbi:MAG: response regulator [Bacteroidia bacterium]|nr:response regulator [Bacteroidia bacterium]